MNLFQKGDFRLHSGAKSDWKIECDALTEEDWAALAIMALPLLHPFSFVEGVPRGGLPFADALRPFARPGQWFGLLIAEDVVTTGGSMEATRQGRLAQGVCVFARGHPPAWVVPIFRMAKP